MDRRNILSIVLAVVIIFSGMAVPTYAENVDDKQAMNENMYGNILDSYYTLLESGDDSALLEAGFNTFCTYPNGDLTNVGYLFLDLDANGIDELIISKMELPFVQDIYTMTNNGAVQVAITGRHNYFYLNTDNTIREQGKWSAGIYGYHYYEYKGENLYYIEGVYESYNEEPSTWWYGTPDTVHTEDFQGISENEAQQIMGKYTEVKYEYTPFEMYKKQSVGKLFEDVIETDWFYDAVSYTYFQGLMTGMDKDCFAPYEPLSRAQFATILYRMEGSPEVDTSSVLTDINGDEWYAKPVLWAYHNGIVTGYMSKRFGPADMITREQMALMMYRYANYLKLDTAQKADYSTYIDFKNVSPFAAEAMQWAVGTGIITGKDQGTRIDPQGNTARAEAAVIIQRFLNYSKKDWVCNERVGEPQNYTGGIVKLVLEQVVDGFKLEKTILENETISFPYELNVIGEPGVEHGKVYMYEMVDGTYKLRCNWALSFRQK